MRAASLIALPASGHHAPGRLAPDPPLSEPRPPVGFDRRLRVLGDAAYEAICVVDDDRHYLRANEAATRVLGAPLAAIIGRRIDDFTLPEHLSELNRLWAQFRRVGSLEGVYMVAQGSGSLQPIRFKARWNFGPREHLIVALETALAPGPDLAAPRLTGRELEILGLAADGCTNLDIARRLVLSPATVKTHLQNAYRKLEVPDRASAVALALRAGLIT